MFNHETYCYSVETCNPDAAYNLSSELIKLINRIDYTFNEKVILCIGTDRSTGDCLGPLVGYKLTSIYKCKEIHVFGTLDMPVHAKNLNVYIEKIYSSYSKPLIIAVDASLGKKENVGKINLFKGPLFPGSGVNKTLNSIGDISITGVVNISGYMEYIVLQNTRLSLVMKMADTIAHGLYIGLNFLLSQEKGIPSLSNF